MIDLQRVLSALHCRRHVDQIGVFEGLKAIALEAAKGKRNVGKLRSCASDNAVRLALALLAFSFPVSVFAASCVGTDLAVNGGVESPVIPLVNYSLRPVTGVPGWTTDDNAIELWSTGFLGVPSHSGNQFLEMNANAFTSIMMQKPSAVQPRAELQVYWAHRGRGGSDTALLAVTDNGGGSSSSGSFTTGATAWVVRSLNHVVGATGTSATLSFDSISSFLGTSNGNFIDSVEVCQTYVTINKVEVSQNDVNGDARDSAGDTVTYQFSIANPAGNNRALSAVAITDDKIGIINVATPLSGDTNSNGLLNPGETWIVRANYTVVQADLNAGQVTNIAFASGNTGSNTIRSSTATVTAVFGKVPALTFDKKQNPATTVPLVVNQVVEYFYDVTNTGNVTAANVNVLDTHLGNGAPPVPDDEAVLTDIAPTLDSTDLGGISNSVWSSLAPGDTVRFKGQYTVTQTDVDLLQ